MIRWRTMILSIVALTVTGLGVLLLGACSGDDSSGATTPSSAANSNVSSAKIQVVAAENFWGSIASQIGGNKVSVTAIITSPDTDPHDYESTPSDGRRAPTAHDERSTGLVYEP